VKGVTERNYKIDELARAAGMSARTVRYYVQRGLLPAPAFKGKDTAYGHEHLVRLKAIRKLQEAYFPLDAIAAELEGRTPTELERFAEGKSLPSAHAHAPAHAHAHVHTRGKVDEEDDVPSPPRRLRYRPAEASAVTGWTISRNSPPTGMTALTRPNTPTAGSRNAILRPNTAFSCAATGSRSCATSAI